MSEPQPTLAHLFADGRGAIDAGAYTGAAGDLLRQEVAARVPGIPWRAVGDGVADQIGGLFDVGLGDLFAGAWNRSRELRKYRDRDKYPPEETYVTNLLDHKFRSKHKPYIELLLDGQPLEPRIEFDLTVTLRLRGFALTIQDARIRAIHTGTVEGSGTLALRGAKLLERPLGKFKLPGKIPLGEGIAID